MQMIRSLASELAQDWECLRIDEELRADLHRHARRGVSEGRSGDNGPGPLDADGGYLPMPPEAAELVRHIHETSPMRQIARVRPRWPLGARLAAIAVLALTAWGVVLALAWGAWRAWEAVG